MSGQVSYIGPSCQARKRKWQSILSTVLQGRSQFSHKCKYSDYLPLIYAKCTIWECFKNYIQHCFTSFREMPPWSWRKNCVQPWSYPVKPVSGKLFRHISGCICFLNKQPKLILFSPPQSHVGAFLPWEPWKVEWWWWATKPLLIKEKIMETSLLKIFWRHQSEFFTLSARWCSKVCEPFLL